ncbi:hypothetical protein IQ268_03805 [Oculatella sp. LEGE 06141]|uniref:hypothetical protein n=1 Tax=Oculatella sp. LEGE 06141 TaxID=1828648 RepID=UPI001880207D|nr:hypothetical protein [Oculatella sp. LEGE 06141]MBE9177704.1 hypothetical protein [Oculatella sp. LEGE 06141]
MKRLIYGTVSAALLATAIAPVANAQMSQPQTPGSQQMAPGQMSPGQMPPGQTMPGQSGQPMTPGQMDQQYNRNSPQGLDQRTGSPMAGQMQTDLTAFQVVNLARQGYFSEQGIPSYYALSTAVTTGQVTADDVIQAAVDSYGLSSERADSAGYEISVQRQLDSLGGNNRYFNR